jgi:O-Antigen ligase
MTLTITGTIILFFALIIFFRSGFELLTFIIISIPFSATAVVNLGSGESATGIPITIFLVLLYIFRSFIFALISNKIKKSSSKSLYLLLIFIFFMFFSLIIPILYKGMRFFGTNARASGSNTFVLSFGSENIIQGGYFLIWGVFLIFATKEVNSIERFRKILVDLMYTGLFTSLWGWFQIMLSIFHIPYPFQIFNNTASFSGQGYLQTIGNSGISRISSVSVEPSIFASYLLILISILSGFILKKENLLGFQKDRIFFSIFLLTVILSTSLIGYVGIFCLFLIFLIYIFVLGKNFHTRLVTFIINLIIFCIILYTLYSSFSVFRNIIDNFLLNKGDSFSYNQRSSSIKYAIDGFLKFPLIGIGVNSMSVYSLPFWLLVNTGLFGFISFFWFYFSLFKYPNSLSNMGVKFLKSQGIGLGILISLVIMLVVTFISGFPYNFGYFWITILFSFWTKNLFNSSKIQIL